MKQVYFLFFSLLLLINGLIAQVNLPYTLNFTTHHLIFGNIVKDGQGGTDDINGLNIEIYPANTPDLSVPLANTPMVWDSGPHWGSGDRDFSGIGPDMEEGVPILIIRSDNAANPFTLVSLKMYDWGDQPQWRFYTYRNGIFVGSVVVDFDDVTHIPYNATKDNILTASVFQNIDEIRIMGTGTGNIFPVVNQIGLASPIALPVKTLDLQGTVINNQAVLRWKSGIETAISRYEVQQSMDAKSFKTVATVAPKGSGSSYKQTIALTGGIKYFRLKIIDQDKSIAFSKVVDIKDNNKASLSIYPNPANQFIYVTAGNNGVAEIIDAGGRKVKSISLNAGTNDVDITGLVTGLYYLLQNGQKLSFIKK